MKWKRTVVVFLEIFCVISVMCLAGDRAPRQVQEQLPDKPIRSQPDWLESARALAQSPRLVHSSRADGDEDYYFKGNTLAFNEFLCSFEALKLPKSRIAFKKQYGKINHRHFNWVLHIPSRTVSPAATGIKPEHIYPSVTVYATTSDIRLAEVVLPEGADVVVLDRAVKDHWHVAEAVETAKKWALAKRKWLDFIGPYLSGIRQREHNPSIQYVEMRSALISEYLPDHKVYVVETRRGNTSSLFALSITGEITDLGNGDWSKHTDEQYLRSRNLSTFLARQSITVSDADTGIGITKLVEEISRAPNQATLLRRSTSNFTIFDRRLCHRFRREENWKYDAKRQRGYWLVTSRYVGPPAMIMKPPRWEVVLGENKQFVEIRHK